MPRRLLLSQFFYLGEMMSSFFTWYADASMLQIAAIIIGMLFAGSLLGGIARRRKSSKPPSHDPETAETQMGWLIAAMLGNLGLLLAFTFSVALDRYESRRVLAIEEANAIGTAYLRVQLLDEPYRSRISSILVAYTNNRLELGLQAKARAETLAINDALLRQLWRGVVVASHSERTQKVIVPITQSFNQLIDLDLERKLARRTRVPSEVFLALYIYLFALGGVLGYMLEGRRAKATAAALYAMVFLTIMLIADLDQPVSGLVRESQYPLVVARDTLAASPPAVFD